jgi:UDP-N-acetylmuramyl tripeptide synthase
MVSVAAVQTIVVTEITGFDTLAANPFTLLANGAESVGATGHNLLSGTTTVAEARYQGTLP